MPKNKVLAILVLITALSGCDDLSDAVSRGPALSIQMFRDAISTHGLNLERESEKMYGLIGAIDGYGMTVGQCRVEIYEFDTTIKSGRDALARLVEDGVNGRRAAQNKNLALLYHCKPDNSDYAKVSEILYSL